MHILVKRHKENDEIWFNLQTVHYIRREETESGLRLTLCYPGGMELKVEGPETPDFWDRLKRMLMGK
jgi:hypothetical protein